MLIECAQRFHLSFGTENCGISLITETKLWFCCIAAYNVNIENYTNIF